MKISKLIACLKSVKKQVGDKEVLIASDEEGNRFGTISEKSFSFDKENESIKIYPSTQVDG